MVFSSITFLFYFLPIVILFYFLVPQKCKNFVLFVVSLIFYAWGEPVYLFLMLFSILCNYLFGRGLGRVLAENGAKANAVASDGADVAVFPGGRERERARWAKGILIASVVVNIGLLGFFKYADFIVDNLNRLAGLDIAPLDLPLPLGISFYTFQAMSYVIDLYRGNVRMEKNLISFGAYVALFPQLIAGPIVRMRTIIDELENRRHSADLFSDGVVRFVTGLGKKVLLANNAGLIFTHISQMDVDTIPALTAWIGVIAFTFQIYFDFSGYSDMAIGLGRMFGFHFLENFDYPYMAKNITEFWRRWHISLSSWFREYVYIPLGGNKKGLLLQLRNILIVWALTGIWHGASWNFVVWGLYFGLILVAEKLFLLRLLEHVPAFLRHVYTMFFVVISWAIFAFDSMEEGARYLGAMFFQNGRAFFDGESIYLLYTNAALFFILALGCTSLPRSAARLLLGLGEGGKIGDGREGRESERKREKRDAANERGSFLSAFATGSESLALLCIFLLSVAYLVSSSYNPFLYFRF